MLSIIASVALSFALTGTPAGPVVEVPTVSVTSPVVQQETEFWALWDTMSNRFEGYKVEYVATRTDGAELTLEPFTYALPADGVQHIYKVTKLHYA